MAFGLTGLGFILAWRMDSTQGFHAIMNLFLMPLWLLSGALFPLDGAPHWLRMIMRLNPLTYGVSALHHALAMRAAGLPDPILYVGSYSDWSRSGEPVATGPEPGEPPAS